MATQNEYVEYGDLRSLIGIWEGVKGWNVIAVPAGDGTADNPKSYKLIVQNYYETLTFEPIEDPVLNEGGAVDQVIGAIKYKQEIHEFDSNTLLHVETGMLFYLDKVECNTDCDSPWTPPYTIARSGTVPHGNSLMILGDAVTNNGGPVIPDVNTHPDIPQRDLDQYQTEQDRLSVEDIVTGNPESKIFDVQNPNYNLDRDNRGLQFQETIHIQLDSENSGGLVNLPFINKFANTTRAIADYWIQKVNLPMSDETFTQLQYSQTVNLEFSVEVDGEEKLVTFPHITTNTLQLKR